VYDDNFWAINDEVIRQNEAWSNPSRQDDTLRNQSKQRSGGLAEQTKHIFERTAHSAYRSELKAPKGEVPQIAIVAGIFLCRLMLWGLLRMAANQGIDAWDL